MGQIRADGIGDLLLIRHGRGEWWRVDRVAHPGQGGIGAHRPGPGAVARPNYEATRIGTEILEASTTEGP